MAEKKIRIDYFAILREERGLEQETVTTETQTALQLYRELAARHNFSLKEYSVRVSVNEEIVNWHEELKDGDWVVFIPPVAGG
jgi:molybdopterin converting factor subunit 1